MARRRVALVCALVTLLLALAAPAFAQEPPRIKPGLSAAGVDLSGLTVEEGAAKLDAALAPILLANLTIGVAGIPWNLTMAEAKLKHDSVRTAKRALYAKPGVTVVPLALSHSRLAVKAFVEGIASKVHRAPRDAQISITLRQIFRKRSRPGHRLDVAATRKLIDTTLATPGAPRILHKRLTRVRPNVNANDLARVYNTVLTIDRSSFRLRLFKGLRFRKSYPIAVGMAGVDTPAGRYRIQNKQVNPAWHVPNSAWAGSLRGQVIPGGAPNNPLKARWMGIANGVGIHGTAESWSIGSRASHGCIRMHVSDVVDLYPRVPVGAPVLIV